MQMKQRCAAALLLCLLLGGCTAQPTQSAPAPTPSATPAPTQSAPIEPEGSKLPAEVPSPSLTPTVSDVPDAPASTPAGEDPAPAPTTPVCTISIDCSTLLSHLDKLDTGTAELVPADGILLPAAQVELQEGDSVFEVLRRVCQANKLHIEFEEAPVYGSAYIEGIGNLYEFDCGPLSGWQYRVNGVFPNYGCSQYTVRDADVIEWVYTCDLGADVGGGELP